MEAANRQLDLQDIEKMAAVVVLVLVVPQRRIVV
jgi:hypothetical protein